MVKDSLDKSYSIFKIHEHFQIVHWLLQAEKKKQPKTNQPKNLHQNQKNPHIFMTGSPKVKEAFASFALPIS